MIKEREKHRAISNGYRLLHQKFEVIYRNYERHGYQEEAELYKKVAEGFKDVYLRYEHALNS